MIWHTTSAAYATFPLVNNLISYHEISNFLYFWILKYTYMHIYMCIYIYTYMHIYMCIYIYTYRCIYIVEIIFSDELEKPKVIPQSKLGISSLNRISVFHFLPASKYWFYTKNTISEWRMKSKTGRISTQRECNTQFLECTCVHVKVCNSMSNINCYIQPRSEVKRFSMYACSSLKAVSQNPFQWHRFHFKTGKITPET